MTSVLHWQVTLEEYYFKLVPQVDRICCIELHSFWGAHEAPLEGVIFRIVLQNTPWRFDFG